MRRLLEVAVNDDDIFSLDEFNHLKKCADCLNDWSDFIRTAPIQSAFLPKEIRRNT
jgi:hypothetical protein